MKNSREEIMKLFQIGDTAYMLNVVPRTLRRWCKAKKIYYTFDRTNGYKLFPLSEINRIRNMQQMPPLSDEEAVNIWLERHGGFYE